jgi:hypothetical protein
MPSSLAGLATREEYQASRQTAFRSIQSLLWYERVNRKGLRASGAIVTVAGRNLIDPQLFDHYVLRQGREAAQKVAA